MTIYIVQPAIPGYRGAFFRRLQFELLKCGETLSVYAADQDNLGVKSITPVGFDGRLGSKIRTMLGGRALWQTGLNFPLTRGDVLVIDGNPRWLNNYPLLLRAKLQGVPVVWWGQGWSAGSRGHRAKVRQRIMRLADVVILYTDKERDEYLSMGFSLERTFALNNGLDVDSIDGAIAEWDASRIQEFRRANGLDACSHWCIFIGRLTRKSEIGLLIESLAKIRGDIGLIVVGDGPVAGEARDQARALAVEHRIIWAGAHFEECSIAPWMLSASVFVYPGAVGLSLIHGFAYGLPAVIHGDRWGHGPEFAAFENGRNGLTFECGSAHSLACAINQLFDDEARRQVMARRAGALVRETFNVNDMAERFVAAIDGLRRESRGL